MKPDALLGAPDWPPSTPRRRGEPAVQTDLLATSVIGAAIEVHRELGPGYVESVYEAALAIELRRRDIPVELQVVVDLVYKGEIVGNHRLDMLVGAVLVVEPKSCESVANAHMAQVLSYLKATNLELALILNFGRPTLREGLRRVARTDDRSV